MSTTDVVSTDALKARIVEKVKQIGQTDEAKKALTKSYNDTLKVMKEELDTLLEELDVAQRAELEDAADEILVVDKQSSKRMSD